MDNTSFICIWVAYASEQDFQKYLSKMPWSRGNMLVNSFVQYPMFIQNIFFSMGLIVHIYRVIWKRCRAISQTICTFLALLYLLLHWIPLSFPIYFWFIVLNMFKGVGSFNVHRQFFSSWS